MSQIKWSVKDVANVMHISNMVGDLIMRKESLEELTNYGFSDGQSQTYCLLKSNVSLIKIRLK